MKNIEWNKLIIALLFSTLTPVVVHAEIENADPEDIDYIAEHLPEAAMNNRFLSLPFPIMGIDKGRKEAVVQPGFSQVTVDFLKLTGSQLSGSVGYSFQRAWQGRLIGFYDRQKFSGGSGQDLLNPLFSESIPLDIPEYASFSNPRGDYIHWGMGAALDWEAYLSPKRDKSWIITMGALFDRLDLKNYQIDYQMLTGASAGQSGVLDHSARYDFVTPFLGIQFTKILNESFSISPRFIGGVPLPKRGWIGRITGPGFDVSGDTKVAGNGSHMGDGFAGLGFAVNHLSSGLSVDIGMSLYQALFEGKIHKGIDKVVLVNVAWTFITPHPNSR